MDLKEFVKTSLSQILEGIREAQAARFGENIAAEAYHSSGNLFSAGTYGMFTIVDFDVSVVAETKTGGGTIRVASIETSDGNRQSAQNASRVKFAVHVRLPMGAKSTVQSRNTVVPSDYDPFQD